MGEQVRAGSLDLWVDRRGQGPDVLIIAGLGDPVEAWQFQLEGLSDRYQVTAFDSPGAGRSPMLQEPFTVADMADHVAGLLRALAVPTAHIVSQSGGSAIAQELALRHPQLVRSLVLVGTWARPDAYLLSTLGFFRWLPEVAPSERAFLEAFCLWIYTPRAHANGMVEQVIQGLWRSRTRCPPRPCSAGWMPSSPTTPPTASRRSPRRRWCWPVVSTEPPHRTSAEPWPMGSLGPGSRCCPMRAIGPSQRPRTSSTRGSTPSGARLASSRARFNRGAVSHTTVGATRISTPVRDYGRRAARIALPPGGRKELSHRGVSQVASRSCLPRLPLLTCRDR
jgi:pimeloyl-ACP methyl ester carboxylesterase